MYSNGKPKTGGQPSFADVHPVIARVVTAIYTTMILLINDIWSGRVHHHLMNALTKFREFVWHKIGAHIFIARLPGLPAIVGAVTTRGGNSDIHPVQICGIKKDGM